MNSTLENLQKFLESVAARLRTNPDLNDGVLIFNNLDTIIFSLGKGDQDAAFAIQAWLQDNCLKLRDFSTDDYYAKKGGDWAEIIQRITHPEESGPQRTSNLKKHLKLLADFPCF